MKNGQDQKLKTRNFLIIKCVNDENTTSMIICHIFKNGFLRLETETASARL